MVHSHSEIEGKRISLNLNNVIFPLLCRKGCFWLWIASFNFQRLTKRVLLIKSCGWVLEFSSSMWKSFWAVVSPQSYYIDSCRLENTPANTMPHIRIRMKVLRYPNSPTYLILFLIGNKLKYPLSLNFSVYRATNSQIK